MKNNSNDQVTARLWFLIIVVVAVIVIGLFVSSIVDVIKNLRPAEVPEEHTELVVEEIALSGAPAKAAPDTACPVDVPILLTYTDGEGPAPAWYDPTEPMAAEWIAEENADKNTDNSRTIHGQTRTTRTDIGCPDWNLCTSLIGWDGHMMEVWEMDLFSRIVYLEFWGTSPECCEAGADSILQLWDSGYFGDTIGEVLSATAEDGSLVYSPYAYVWDWDYDAEGLADMRDLCESRFYGGPTWCAPFFRLWYYHEWAVPCYEIDGVYFSTSPFLQ